MSTAVNADVRRGICSVFMLCFCFHSFLPPKCAAVIVFTYLTHDQLINSNKEEDKQETAVIVATLSGGDELGYVVAVPATLHQI